MDDDATSFRTGWVTDRRPIPLSGWRRAVYKGSGGLIDPGPSRAELAAQQQLAAVTAPMPEPKVIAVVSTKGGVGKTTTTLGLGHVLASYRGDRTIAIDANPDAGSLAYRVDDAPIGGNTLDLVEAIEVDRIHGLADLQPYLTPATSRLEVVGSPDDPQRARALATDEYHAIFGLLKRYYSVILADCGTGIIDEATQAVIAAADQLVVVTTPAVDSARAVVFLLDHLAGHGSKHLVNDAVMIINRVQGRVSKRVDTDALAAQLNSRVSATIIVPHDPDLAAGDSTRLDSLRSSTVDAYIAAAGQLVTNLTTNGQHATRR